MAAASLVIDYILNVAVSISAGVAALTSAFPRLLPCDDRTLRARPDLITLINLYGAS